MKKYGESIHFKFSAISIKTTLTMDLKKKKIFFK